MRAGILCLAGLLMLGCDLPFAQSGAVRAAATAVPIGARVPGSAGYIYSLAWLRDGTLAVGTGPNATPSVEQVWLSHPDGSDVRQVLTPSGAECTFTTRYMFPIPLPDGRMGLTRQCDSGAQVTVRVVAYDQRSGAFSTLADLGDRMPVDTVSWSPDMTRGVGAVSSRICAKVAWITPTGPQGIPVVIGEGGKSWRLDGWLTSPRGADCVRDGRADCPAWSPDGRQVALFASPESIGSEGQSRLDAAWGLYLIDVRSLQVTNVLAGVGDACNLAWSPDGRWLAFTGSIRGQRGVWLFSPAPKALRLVATSGSDAWSPSWSPDGRRLAIIENLSPLGDWPPATRLAVADVSSATAGR